MVGDEATTVSEIPPTIADGTQFGYVVELGADYMLFDAAELFGNEEAQEAALADGAIDDLTRLAAGEDDGYYYYYGLYQARQGMSIPMELTINDGLITGGTEIYLP